MHHSEKFPPQYLRKNHRRHDNWNMARPSPLRWNMRPVGIGKADGHAMAGVA